MRISVGYPILFSLLMAGCTNKPGALQLTLTADTQQVRPSEPIYLQAALNAPAKPVCLARCYTFQVEMSRQGSDEKVSSPRFGVCGTPFMSTIFFYPVFYSMSLLDVADTMDRFDVIEGRTQRIHLLELVAGESGLYPRMDPDQFTEKLDPGWTPGNYTVTVKLQGAQPVFYPAPLFWTPYSHPVEAEIEIHVKAED